MDCSKINIVSFSISNNLIFIVKKLKKKNDGKNELGVIGSEGEEGASPEAIKSIFE